MGLEISLVYNAFWPRATCLLNDSYNVRLLVISGTYAINNTWIDGGAIDPLDILSFGRM